MVCVCERGERGWEGGGKDITPFPLFNLHAHDGFSKN